MRSFALYLSATNAEHNDWGTAGGNRRPQWAPVDALPLLEPAPVPRRGRLMAILRQRVAGAASAWGPAADRRERPSPERTPTKPAPANVE